MKPINVLVAWPKAVVQELRDQRKEQRQLERRESLMAERAARKAARQEERRLARLEGRAEPADDPDDDVVEPAVRISAKPGLGALPSRSRQMIEHPEHVMEYEPLETKQPVVDGVQRKMMSLYVDTEAEIAELEAAGAIILGAWSTTTGEQIREPHRRLGKFMPPRFESVVGQDGEVVTTEVDDETPRPLILLYGQAEPVYG